MKKKILLFILMFLFGTITVNAGVVKIGEIEYTKLSTAISKVDAGVKTTITFIGDVTENVTIPEGKNIVFDLNNYTLSNNGDKTVVTNNGTLEVKNGTITSDAGSGMINNNSKGVLTVTSGNLLATGKRQAIYNDGGTLYISDAAYIESASDERAAIQNRNNGKVYINGGTIISTGLYAIYNEKGTLNIGVKDDAYNKTKPIIEGKTYGIAANNKYNVYDGTIKGGTYHVGKTSNTGNTPTVTDDIDETKLIEIEEDSEKSLGEEVIGGETYKTLSFNLDSTNRIKIIFDANGGTTSKDYKWMYIGNEIGELPVASKIDHSFDGWFTSTTGGTKISSSTKPDQNTTYYAQYTYQDPNTVAYVEGKGVMSLQDAFLAGGNIRLEKDVIITSNLIMSKNSSLDLNGHTISLNDNYIVITNDVTITDSSTNESGKITSNGEFTVYVGTETNHDNAKLTHTAGTIEGLGRYGAIYNYGTTIIDGGTVYGKATENSYVIYNVNDLTIKSGTVHSANGRAVQVGTNSTFVMDGGLLKSDAENDQTLNLYGNCSATINGGTIEGLNYNTAGIAMFHNTDLTINGGTIKGHAMAVAGNGSDSNNNANITINGGTLTATDGVGIYFPQQDSLLTINGGTISGPTGIEIRASKLVINDGNIYGTYDVFENSANASGTTTKGAAVAISQHNTMKPIEVIINGGNLKAVAPLTEVNPMNNPQSATDLISIIVTQGNFESSGHDSIETADDIPALAFITGGTYTTDPSKYVKEGYVVIKKNENKYVVVDSNSIVDDSNNSQTETPVENTNNNESYILINEKVDDTVKESNNPKTIDDIVLYTFMLSTCIVGIGTAYFIKKKKIFS